MPVQQRKIRNEAYRSTKAQASFNNNNNNIIIIKFPRIKLILIKQDSTYAVGLTIFAFSVSNNWHTKTKTIGFRAIKK